MSGNSYVWIHSPSFEENTNCQNKYVFIVFFKEDIVSNYVIMIEVNKNNGLISNYIYMLL